ncbi:MAG TPA: response regulator [Cyclobacteriaceae bacterium]|nr:response regulator [Cyclobacteriaceae bacterium]
MTVYLVDDDAEEAELFTDAVHTVNQSIKVVWFSDVMEALESLLKELHQPTILFLDLNLPKVSGKDLLRLLRQNTLTAHLPVVIYSTTISKRDMDDTAPYQVKAYLQKPENFQALCDKLREVIEAV